ncbi:MAG: SBBP repeat-containing protein [Bacteroidales bacterium]
MKKVIIFILVIGFLNKLSIAQAPDWSWAKTNSGISDGESKSICTDSLGNIYMLGDFKNSKIIFENDTLYNSDSTGGSSDNFLVKYSANGDVLWAKKAGGSYSDFSRSITVDGFNNIYITGFFYSNFIIFNTDTLFKTNTSAYTSLIYIAKYNPLGDVLWTKCLGDTNNNMSFNITVDIVNNLYVSGGFRSQKIYFDTDTLSNVNPDYSDAFLVKYDINGNEIWVKHLGSSDNDWGTSIKADKIGNVYMTGYFYGKNLVAGNDTLFKTDTIHNLTSDIFLIKFDSNGILQWLKAYGGNQNIYSFSLALDTNRNVYITGGFTSSTVILENDTLFNSNLQYPTARDFFLIKFDESGNEKWAKQSFGSEMENGRSVFIDKENNIFVTGGFASIKSIFGSDTLINNGTIGCNDIFIIKYDTLGNLKWAKNVGSNGDDEGESIVRDINGFIYVSGYFRSTSISFGNYTLYKAQGITTNVFLAKLDPSILTRIENLNIKNNLLLFPNPSSNNLTIEAQAKTEIEIINIEGQIIKKIILNENKTDIDISAFSSGIYIIKALTGNSIITKKFIKE